MATNEIFVQDVVDHLQNAGDITFRKMFGEYALYSNGKVVALIADNQVFVKPTEEGRTFIGDVIEGFAYPGAKPSLWIQDKFEDTTWFSELIRITEKALPESKPKKKKKVDLEQLS